MATKTINDGQLFWSQAEAWWWFHFVDQDGGTLGWPVDGEMDASTVDLAQALIESLPGGMEVTGSVPMYRHDRAFAFIELAESRLANWALVR